MSSGGVVDLVEDDGVKHFHLQRLLHLNGLFQSPGGDHQHVVTTDRNLVPMFKNLWKECHIEVAGFSVFAVANCEADDKSDKMFYSLLAMKNKTFLKCINAALQIKFFQIKMFNKK